MSYFSKSGLGNEVRLAYWDNLLSHSFDKWPKTSSIHELQNYVDFTFIEISTMELH